MLTSIDANTMKGKWVSFNYDRLSESGKTKVFKIVSDDNYLLGRVEWFGRWRKYSFVPYSLTVYEETCLRDIAEFIELQTKRHRSEKKAE